MNRIMQEFSGLARHTTSGAFLSYMWHVAMHMPEIFRTKNLTCADRDMHGTYTFHTWGKDISVNCGEIDTQTTAFDESVIFTLLRELYARNVYLRAFAPFDAKGSLVVDLGANRGVFSTLAAAALNPDEVISVEPLISYKPVYERLISEFPEVPHRLCTGFVGDAQATVNSGVSNLGVQCYSMSELIGAQSVAFLKMDIEGAEEPLFCSDTSWLKQVERMAMEAHPRYCHIAPVISALEKNGFLVKSTDALGAPAKDDAIHYIYAAKQKHDFLTLQ